MERIVATHHIEGHTVDVVELVDDDGIRFELVVDGTVVPVGEPVGAELDVDEVTALVRRHLGETTA